MSIENNPEIDAIVVSNEVLDEQLAKSGRDPEWGLPPKRTGPPDFSRYTPESFEEIRRKLDAGKGRRPFNFNPRLRALAK